MTDIGQEYIRAKEGFRYKFGGVKTNSVADSLPPDKYPYALNIRAIDDNSVQTREGLEIEFPTTASPVTDIRTYTALGTDNTPRILVRDANDQVYLGQPAGTSILVGTLASNTASGIPSPGAAMIPFRPAESPTPYMYIANGVDYQKFSAPGAADAVVMQKVGIAEPQSAPDACVVTQLYFNAQFFIGASLVLANATGGAVVNRLTDVTGTSILDPSGLGQLGIPYGLPWSIQVSAGKSYQRYQSLSIASAGLGVIEDVYQPFTVPVIVQSMYYFGGGSTGHCVVVPKNMAQGPGAEGVSLQVENELANLRRGALIQFSGFSEVCYVWNVTLGPDGTICFETFTANAHVAGETLTSLPAVHGTFGNPTIPPGSALNEDVLAISVASGVGTATINTSNPFTNNFGTVQPDDYVVFQVYVDNLTNLNELKLLFDCGDGSFTQNFYYYAVRPNDIVAGISNTLTQLGAAQIVSQRATIDEENAAAARNQQQTASSAQTSPGSGQWSQVVIPISAFTRVGNDLSKSLQNVTKMQALVNCSATVNVQLDCVLTCGGYQADVGPSGAPYLYRVRPRSSVTGTKGNPSPATRYGVNPRRQQVQVLNPSALYDPQIDTLDIFRYGGTVTSWRKIGQCPSTQTIFNDNYSDDAALAGEELEFDNLEPWPSITAPLNTTASSVIGTVAVLTLFNPTFDATELLPGNLVRLGGVNVYTLWTRPIVLQITHIGPNISVQYQFQLVENAGSIPGGTTFSIYEPLVARQFLPYMWGPDAEGTVFAVGDPLRPGTFSFAKNYAPDAAPDSYNIEITAPTEPLLGGEILDGLSFVASSERWWALYPQPTNPAQRYAYVQQPLPRGLAAPYGHCTDGKTIWWWAKDGVWDSQRGSLSDADLYNLFPHEGVPGADYTYAGQTISAPDYKSAGKFRLAYANYYLYATYLDLSGNYHTLTFDTRRGSWCPDEYFQNGPAPEQATVFYHPEQQEGTVLTPIALYPMVLAGSTLGNVYSQEPASPDVTATHSLEISAAIATREWDGGDLRAGMQWGDLYLDCNPASPLGILCTPLFLGSIVSPQIVLPTSTTRVLAPLSLGGGVLSNFLGMLTQWTDDFTRQDSPTSLHAWQPSFLPKPETSLDRFTDWYELGEGGAAFVQGFLLHADTSNVVKGIVVRDGDTLTTRVFTPAVNHNGESILAYSFVTPFIAHTVRLEPTDMVPWRFFDVEWIFQSTPEAAETWTTQATSFGFNGYSHIQRIVAAYAATAPVTLTITAQDGTSPIPITLPSTGGVTTKLLVVLTFNKGQLYTFSGVSPSPWRAFWPDWEIIVGGWGRSDGYTTYKSLGGPRGDKAMV